MRIGLISFHSFYQPGGVKRHVLGLHKEFKRRGIYSKIIAPRRKWSEDYGKDVILLGTSFPLSFSGSQADFDINFNPLAIERVLKKEKFDVLHFHNFGFPSAYQILEKSEALNILTFHANISGSKFFKRFPSLLYVFNRLAQWKIDGVIGVAPLNIKVFKKYTGPKAVITNGIDLDEFNLKVPKLEKFTNDKINILFVGRIEERKGLIYLLKAYKILSKKFSHLRLYVVGEGELKEKCQDYIRKNNLKEIYFEGQIIGKKLVSYYRSCDIFVSPAIFGESFGLVLLEAMACGAPVVAFANEGYKAFLKDKRGGKFLAQNRSYQDLAKKIEILIKNKKLRKEMSKWGIEEAQNYSWSKIADRVLDFYQLCLKERGKRETGDEFFLDKILNKIYNQDVRDVINWLKKLR